MIYFEKKLQLGDQSGQQAPRTYNQSSVQCDLFSPAEIQSVESNLKDAPAQVLRIQGELAFVAALFFKFLAEDNLESFLGFLPDKTAHE